MKKVTFFLLTVTFFLFIGIGNMSNTLSANTASNNVTERDKYLNIITVNKSQYYLVKTIVGDRHNIQYMFSNKQDIMDFKFTEETIENISNMDLFFYTGYGFEPWINEFIHKLKKGNLGIINISRGIRSQTIVNGDKSIDNPYYWSGIDEYKIALYNVKSAIQDRDPKNREFYEENYNKAIKAFEKKIEEQKKLLENTKGYNFLVVGDSYDYFLKSIGIDFTKVENNKVDEVIKEKKLDPSKVVIIKDNNVEIQHKTPLKYVASLENFNGDKSFEELILSNIEEIIKLNLEIIK
ncbi:MAG: metal ABC transporter substrate-binding protein [Clostridium sp.]